MRTIVVLALTAGMVLAFTGTASATIHEIVGSFCAATHEVPSPTGDIHSPPGLTPDFLGGTSQADNIAQPLFASGAYDPHVAGTDSFWVVAGLDSNNDPIFAPMTDEGALLIDLDDEQPQVKFNAVTHPGDGDPVYFFAGTLDGQNIYIQVPQPDPSFPGFANCANLSGH